MSHFESMDTDWLKSGWYFGNTRMQKLSSQQSTSESTLQESYSSSETDSKASALLWAQVTEFYFSPKSNPLAPPFLEYFLSLLFLFSRHNALFLSLSLSLSFSLSLSWKLHLEHDVFFLKSSNKEAKTIVDLHCLKDFPNFCLGICFMFRENHNSNSWMR